ncbi:hypothetical protein POM88_035025 [Heracleum sosnowskyi]|uniref:PHD finger protein n=1 Tax=Heracleum sosnowskyi TaxID=360622 RepID=A0AAD8HLE7_9APIA|nr:hypothetical protein POM88_035025 [Heracleum sosnowskyi]
MELALSLEKLTNEKLLHLHEVASRNNDIAVHLDCYRSVKDSGGPWCCELCEDLSSSRSFVAMAVNSWEKPYFLAECGLCGGTGGAFRKTTDGQWIHVFCAEWVLESTFKRGQANVVQGMSDAKKKLQHEDLDAIMKLSLKFLLIVMQCSVL